MLPHSTPATVTATAPATATATATVTATAPAPASPSASAPASASASAPASVSDSAHAPAAEGLLVALGVPEGAERLYLHILARPGRSTDDLRTDLALGREQALAALESLAAHGLVQREPGAPACWSAVAPDIAVQALLLRREEELCRTRGRIGELMRTYHSAQQHPVDDLLEVVTGREAIAERWRGMQEGARRRMLIFDKPPHVARADADLELPMLDRGVQVRVVYEAESLGAPGRMKEIHEFVEAGEEARMLPGLPCKLALVDDTWAMLPVSTGSELRGALFMRAPSLLEALVAMFDMYWHRAVRVPSASGATDAPGTSRTVGERRRKLLTLLSAGLTDDSIARQLGVSPRTVQRWVHEVMETLGARTRFQAGIQAARAGLL
ncbi:helix-turn-helix domain-containing protein [Streptomyces beihaiensis]|uniref:Helix-turn-helix domain-containing protein n=1 Tax=Streptomyces beihaiensis TaxID=2984495 RepID=A0ABT3TPW3_9ACTN|nr:helix-turn-helix domain-containing protein [Streptomyces beihaiensis]MCX3059077.1 helix-turn-helix domain-containing protein [Streptomyces beihaiensis]